MEILNKLDSLAPKFEPDPLFQKERLEGYDIDQKKLAFWVGFIALMLPIIMILSSVYGGQFRDSISHYYYTKILGGIFVISLSFIGTFLIAYTGASRLESALATLAGWATYGIAFFPTANQGFEVGKVSAKIFVELEAITDVPFFALTKNGLEFAFQQHAVSSYIHFGCATALFTFLAFYSFRVFPHIDENRHKKNGKLTSAKSKRNTIYYITGWIIVISIVAIASQWIWGKAWDNYNLTFWFEAFALWAFGISWIVKGRLWGKFLLDDNEIKILHQIEKQNTVISSQ